MVQKLLLFDSVGQKREGNDKESEDDPTGGVSKLGSETISNTRSGASRIQ